MTVRLLVRGVASGSVMAAVCLVTSVHAQTTLDDPAGATLYGAPAAERVDESRRRISRSGERVALDHGGGVEGDGDLG